MINVGPDKENEGKYIFRHDDCCAGSDKWLTHFMHKSTLRSLFMSAEGKKMNAEAMRSLGEKIVEKTKEKHEKAICDRMDAKRGVGVNYKTIKADTKASTGRNDVHAKRPSEGVVASGKKGGVSGKKSWRTMSIRRGRK